MDWSVALIVKLEAPQGTGYPYPGGLVGCWLIVKPEAPQGSSNHCPGGLVGCFDC